MKKFHPALIRFVEIGLPVLSLFFLVFYTYIFFIQIPYLDFEYSSNSGKILLVSKELEESGTIRVDDTLVQVGNTLVSDARTDPSIAIFQDAKPGDTITIKLIRNGNLISTDYYYAPPELNNYLDRLNSQWLLQFVFWLAGTATLLFIRPRSTQQLLMSLFFFFTAMWISTGVQSWAHYAYSHVVFHVMIWLSVPVALHFHWEFPVTLRKISGWVWAVVYGIFGVSALMEIAGLLPSESSYFGFLIILLGSLMLLIFHFVNKPETRQAFKNLIFAIFLALISPLLMAIMNFFGYVSVFSSVLVISLSVLPGFYFFTICQNQYIISTENVSRFLRFYIAATLIVMVLTTMISISISVAGYELVVSYFRIAAFFILAATALIGFSPFLVIPTLSTISVQDEGQDVSATRISANRAASVVFYILLFLPVFALLNMLIFSSQINQTTAYFISVISSTGVVFIAIAFLPAFETFFQRVILGIRINPKNLLSMYADRITTSLSMKNLRDLLVKEVFPSLLVRQFAFVLNPDEYSNGNAILMGVKKEMMPDVETMKILLSNDGKMLSPIFWQKPHPWNWIRLVIVLSLGKERKGVWLMGKRDPDDTYYPAEIELLNTLANQTALALNNIEQTAVLRELYLSDVDRHEKERVHLAMELHDDVLNQLAVLGTNLDPSFAGDKVQKSFDNAVLRVRKIVNGLRPSMLEYGLLTGIEAMLDEIYDRFEETLNVEVNIENDAMARYDNRIELYVFRIVQQACTNALQHAKAASIKISGYLRENELMLQVEDDGVGFEYDGRGKLVELLTKMHFGLAGMYERAEIIRANLEIDTHPGKGTRICVYKDMHDNEEQDDEMQY